MRHDILSQYISVFFITLMSELAYAHLKLILREQSTAHLQLSQLKSEQSFVSVGPKRVDST